MKTWKRAQLTMMMNLDNHSNVREIAAVVITHLLLASYPSQLQLQLQLVLLVSEVAGFLLLKCLH